jgi:hypothetical protein
LSNMDEEIRAASASYKHPWASLSLGTVSQNSQSFVLVSCPPSPTV